MSLPTAALAHIPLHTHPLTYLFLPPFSPAPCSSRQVCCFLVEGTLRPAPLPSAWVHKNVQRTQTAAALSTPPQHTTRFGGSGRWHENNPCPCYTVVSPGSVISPRPPPACPALDCASTGTCHGPALGAYPPALPSPHLSPSLPTLRPDTPGYSAGGSRWACAFHGFLRAFTGFSALPPRPLLPLRSVCCCVGRSKGKRGGSTPTPVAHTPRSSPPPSTIPDVCPAAAPGTRTPCPG